MWPPEALEFLRELEDNNDRDWFRANRARYDAHLVAPARALAAGIEDLGPLRLFRPYNDARFHHRPPIKEQLGLAIGYGGGGGYYVELSLDGLLVGAGLHHPASDQLDRFRQAIDDGRRAKGFEQALEGARGAGLQIIDPELKRAPRGYPADHPRVEHLRRKHLTVFRRHALEPWLHEPACAERIAGELRAARPLVAWLAARVGPSQLERRGR
ncbi:MAG: hypothetical protein QOJ35_1893 [Solirubrobacteraceae bacterium]|jgi:uncharacterized protein (TIGR02453 family)|nr:hypothetical protein [Solirubrobacteraceae bacterium]